MWRLLFHAIMRDITVYSCTLVAKLPPSGTSVDLSDISKDFEVDYILFLRMDISEIITVKTPFASP
jgi:hypothetical protein